MTNKQTHKHTTNTMHKYMHTTHKHTILLTINLQKCKHIITTATLDMLTHKHTTITVHKYVHTNTQ